MINFELAEKLYKDGTFKSHVPVTKANEEYLEYPPLSELIGACGQGFQVLKHAGNLWMCYMNGGIWIEGYSPEEVVAKLWLKLNNK